jgi:hypothetical protein
MVVDPNTGMPIQQEEYGLDKVAANALTPGHNTAAGAASGMAAHMGIMSPDSFFSKVLDTIPSATKTTAWNAYRGTRTIGYGARGVDTATSLSATFNPRYLRSMPSMKAMGGRSVKSSQKMFRSSGYAAGEAYTPFNVLGAEKGAFSVNGPLRRMSSRIDKSITKASGLTGKSVQEVKDTMNKSRFGRMQLRMMDYGSAEEGAFSRGAVSRISAMSRISRGKMPTSNVLNFIGETDKDLLQAFKGARSTRYINSVNASKGISFNPASQRFHGPGGKFVKTPGLPADLSKVVNAQATTKEATHLLAMSAQGSITGRATGYMATMSTGVSKTATMAAETTGNVAYMAGSELAAKHMASMGVERVAATGASKGFFRASTAMGPGVLEKFGVKAGEKVGMKTVGKLALEKGGQKIAAKLGAAMALQAVPIAGQVVGALMLADMVVDIGKLGMEGVKSGIDFAKDAVKSYRGSIDKGVMGMGYRDNTVAATSRQRGVMAIQNSRLNARSVLGSEAGAMHAHFG